MKKFFLLLPFIIFVIININIPFVGPYGNNNSTYSLQAKNYLRYGYIKTFFAPLTNPGKNFPAIPNYYLNHPPLLQIFLSFSYKIFGINWWAGRLVTIILSVISILMISDIAKLMFKKSIGLTAIFCAGILPITYIYAKIFQFEIVTLPFILISLYSLIKYLNLKKRIYLFSFYFFLIASFSADLPSAIFFVLITLLFFIEKKEKKNLILSLILLSILFFGYFFYSQYLTKNNLLNAYLGRSFYGSPLNLPNPLFSFLSVIFIRIFIYLTPLGFVSLVYVLKSLRQINLLGRKIIIILFLFPILYILLFLNGAWEHPYWLYYFIPITAISMSLFINKYKKSKLIIAFFIFNFIFSIGIYYLKTIQITKSAWQNEFIEKIQNEIKNDSYLGVNWDFNDDLLRFKTDKNVTIIWDKKSIINYLHNNPQKFHHFIFACWSNCSNGEKELKNKIIATFKISYSDPRGRAYLINLDEKSINSINMNSQLIKSEDTLQNKTPLYIDVYRKIRDFLHLEQI